MRLSQLAIPPLASLFVLGGLSCARVPSHRPRLPDVVLSGVLVKAALVDDTDIRGHVMFVDFWASGYASCRESFSWMNDMSDKYAANGLVIVAVNVDTDRGAAEAFVAEHEPRFEVIYDPEAVLAREYDLSGMPASFVYGRDGSLRNRSVGFTDDGRNAMEQTIRTLLDEGL